jgi:hypothetical protein
MSINKVIIWGHKLHSHTHSYIHDSFYKAFKFLGYNTYWFDENGNNNNGNKEIDFNNSLFLTHGSACNKIPLNNSSIYLFHNIEFVEKNNKVCPKNHIDINKNIGIDRKNIIVFQVYTHDCINRDIPDLEYKYHYYKPNNKIIYFPWATDLLPEEINNNIRNIRNIKYKMESNFIGSGTEPYSKLKIYLNKLNIKTNFYGGTFDINSDRNKSTYENMKLIQDSIIAPALQTEWQCDNGYIPCRIFKNISYGKIGITNNKTVKELFKNEIIYSNNIEELAKKSIKIETNTNKYQFLIPLMEEVRDNHTYINRVNYIFKYIKFFLNINMDEILRNNFS